MNIINIAEPALIFDASEAVSRVAAKMLEKRRREALIFDRENPVGAVFARNLAKRKINQPDKSKIAKFAEHINLVSLDTDMNNLVRLVLVNDYSAVPACEENRFFFITKLGMLKAMKNRPELRGKKASDVMNPPYCVNTDDSVATTISVLRETGVSRLPVINKGGGAEGIVDSLDLLRADIVRDRMKLGEEAGEKTRLGEVNVSSLMKKDFPRVRPDDSLNKVIDIMIDREIPTAIVEDGQKIVGIITPKPILRLLTGKPKGTCIRINGLQEESNFIKSVVDEEICNTVRKLGNMVTIDYIVLHADKYHKTGRRKKYSVKARLITGRGMFFADDHAWDVTKAVRGVMSKLEREVLHKIGKGRVYRRGP